MPIHSTASDEWHRESERHGIDRDRAEVRERCEPAPPLAQAAQFIPEFIHPDFPHPSPGSSDELFAEHIRQARALRWAKIIPGESAPTETIQEDEQEHDDTYLESD